MVSGWLARGLTDADYPIPERRFDPETTRAMGAALEMACVALRTGGYADDVKQAIAIALGR